MSIKKVNRFQVNRFQVNRLAQKNDKKNDKNIKIIKNFTKNNYKKYIVLKHVKWANLKEQAFKHIKV